MAEAGAEQVSTEVPGAPQEGPKKKPSEMTNQEYQEEMDKLYRPKGPDAPQSPVHPFWESVKAVMTKQRDPMDIARSIGRGALSAVTETGDTLAEGAAYVDRKTGLGENLTPGFNAAYDAPGGGARGIGEGTFTQTSTGKNVSDAVLGKRSDDGLASFAEGAAQFTTAFEMTGGLKLAKGVLGIVARGAVTDASAFNPYEAQLAELAAKAPPGIVHTLGALLSVKGDDSELVARLKRGAVGAVSGLAIEGFVAGARLVRGGKVLADASATPAEKELARTQVTESAEKLKDISAGTAVPEGAHVVVKDAPGGDGFVLSRNPESPALSDDAMRANMADTGFASGAGESSVVVPKGQRFLEAESPDSTVNVMKRAIAEHGAEAVRAAGKAEIAARGVAGNVDAEKAAIEQAVRNMVAPEGEAARGVISPMESDRSQPASLMSPTTQESREWSQIDQASPVFPSRAEAETQAATMNGSITARLRVGEVDDAAVERLINSTESPEKFAEATADPQLDVSHHNTVDQDMGIVAKLSKKLADKIRTHVYANGQLDVPTALKMAQDGIREIPEDAAHPIMKALLKSNPENQSVVSLMADMVLKDKGKNIMKLSDVVDARPHDPVAMQELVTAINNYTDLRHTMYETTAEQGRALRFKQEREVAQAMDVNYYKDGEAAAPAAPVEGESGKPAAPKKGAKPDTTEPADVAGMKARRAGPAEVDEANAAAIGRMFKMADGEPRNADAIIRGTAVLQETGNTRKALEYFVNALLSGPKTWLTVLTSGATMSTFEPIVRMAAGLKTGNVALFREGADIMYGNMRYMVDNMASAAAAFREGRSITNPMPQQVAIGGMAGDLVRLPSDVLSSMHEFTTVTNYRSFIRSKSLRIAREQGLTGDALSARVDSDLRAAFDEKTGIATVPEGLKYAQNATFTAPLEKGTFSAGFQDFTNNTLEAKFIAPFVKISSNIFNYTWKATPFLNRYNKSAQAILDAGGEEADVLRARTAIMGGIYATGMYQAFSGNLTGAGPSDPQLKSLWLMDHQPYSVKVGDQWMSYRRVEPFATALGLMGDLHTMIQELDSKDQDAEHFAYATVAALSSNFASKTYMQGLTDFMGTWGGGNPTKMKQYLQKIGAGLVVPSGVAAANTDDTMREVNTMREAIMARVPGWSQTLDPRFNIMGEPIMKDPNFARRALSPVAVRSAAPGVEDQLMELNKGMPAFPEKLLGGMIDLTDRTTYDNGTGVSPYARFNALLANPKSGENMRDALTTLVKSDKYQQASGTVEGVELGGKRALYVAAIKTEHEQKAFKQLREEYPKLNDAWKDAQREKGAALKGGQQGLDVFRALRAAR